MQYLHFVLGEFFKKGLFFFFYPHFAKLWHHSNLIGQLQCWWTSITMIMQEPHQHVFISEIWVYFYCKSVFQLGIEPLPTYYAKLV